MTLFFRSAVHEITVPLDDGSEEELDIPAPDGNAITVFFHERRPYYVSYKNEVHGLVADPITLIFKNTGIHFNWEKTPAGRQLDLIRSNESKVCGAGWFKTSERAQFARYTLPIYQDSPLIAVTRADNTLLDNTETIERAFSESRLRLLIKVGYSYGKEIDTQLKRLNPWQIYTTAENGSMLKMIKNHRADYCFMAEEEARDLLFFSGLNKADFRLVHFSNMPQRNFRYLLCSKKVSETTIQKLNNAIEHFINIQDTVP